jgi:uncharacterized membrane protein (UPF0182 family)
MPMRRGINGRVILIVLGLVFFGVIVFGRAIAGFYVDFLWHQGLGRTDVFWGVLAAQLLLFAAFFAVFMVVASVNLLIADKMAPTSFPANIHPYVERFHEVFGHRLRLVRYGTAALFALLLALPVSARWQEWLLFRNSQSFGVNDPQFGVDVGFYVFELPFISFSISWLFAALVVVTLLTVLAHLVNGGVVFTSSMPVVRASTKAHLAVLLAILAIVRAADYWISRYGLTTERRGVVQGATYTVVNAQIPALMLLAFIAVLTSVLFLSTLRTGRWRYPLVASALWLVISIVGGVVYPALVQSLIVRPNQASREAPYIARNIEATRIAMGLGANLENITEVPVTFEDLTAADVEADLESLSQVRLLNPTEFQSRFRVDRGELAGLAIQDLDVDRYEIDGDLQQVLVAARELDLAGVANQSWQGRTLVNTRGCGLVMAPVNRVRLSDRPDYRDVPLDRPELYFSPTLTGYGIAGTAEAERACGDNAPYTGTAGVRMNSVVRRAIFALAFLDYNILGSGAIESESQMLWVRNVVERSAKLAPFLSFDGDPYPVAVNGRVVWIIDAYTSSTQYPYGQRVGSVQLSQQSGVPRDANYLRNSVKVAVDAYDGRVSYYIIDEEDPVVSAWAQAFPNLFLSIDAMGPELRRHLRYPEDLFRIQTDVYSKYRLDALNFFQRVGAWSIAQSPAPGPRQGTLTNVGLPQDFVATEFATESSAARFVPYYSLKRNQVTGQIEFALLRPFVPFSRDDQRTELQAYTTVSSDPDNYGQMVTYLVQGELPNGPVRVASQMESEPAIGREISLQDNVESGTRVRFGDMQLLRVGEGLLYIRPFYVEVQQPGPIPLVTEYRFVIVSHGDRSTYAPTLSQALARLFPGFTADVGDRVGEAGQPIEGVDEFVDPDEGDSAVTPIRPPVQPDRPDPGTEAGAAELLAEAEALFIQAEAALRTNGDLGAYQRTIERARGLVARALAILAEG